MHENTGILANGTQRGKVAEHRVAVGLVGFCPAIAMYFRGAKPTWDKLTNYRRVAYLASGSIDDAET
jgi:hypothetical protein